MVLRKARKAHVSVVEDFGGVNEEGIVASLPVFPAEDDGYVGRTNDMARLIDESQKCGKVPNWELQMSILRFKPEACVGNSWTKYVPSNI